MLQSLTEETEGKLQMLVSPRKDGLASLFKEDRVFKVLRAMGFLVSQHSQLGAIPPPPFLSVSPLGEHAKWGCDTPPSKGVSQRYSRDTL